MMVLGESEAVGPVTGDRVVTRTVRFSSVEEEIRFLRAQIDAYRGHPAIRETATEVVFREGGCPPRRPRMHAICLAEWVQDRITYVHERPELLQTPLRTMRTGFGDCDDFVQLEGALMESIGIPVSVVGMKMAEPIGPGRWAPPRWKHVFLEAVIRVFPTGMERIPLDATLTSPVRELTDPRALALADGRKVWTYRA